MSDDAKHHSVFTFFRILWDERVQPNFQTSVSTNWKRCMFELMRGFPLCHVCEEHCLQLLEWTHKQGCDYRLGVMPVIFSADANHASANVHLIFKEENLRKPMYD